MNIDILASTLPMVGLRLGASLILLVAFVALLLGTGLCQGVRRRRAGQRVLMLGTKPLARWIVEEIDRRRDLGWTIVAVVDNVDKLALALDATRPDRIVVGLPAGVRLPFALLLEARARGIHVEGAVETFERLTGKLALEVLPAGSIVYSDDFQPRRRQLVVTRMLSLTLAALGLVLCLPMIAVIAVAIKLDSRGPVFFVQERVGRRGRTFRLVKFRTMHPTDGAHSEWERDNSDRITSLGKWLRRYRLDELPQLLNVLQGQMNLVGPRPHPVTNLAKLAHAARGLHEQAIPYYSMRCAVPPGITGWAQVRYRYANSLEEEMEKVRYDLYYVKHMSLAFDLRIVFDTVKTVFVGRGVARARRRGAMVGARGGAPLAGEGSAESVAAAPVTPADVRPAGLEHAA
jgi:exopolysaccharide biosynthesis polyprenyl glycosylphosphotransferase